MKKLIASLLLAFVACQFVGVEHAEAKKHGKVFKSKSERQARRADRQFARAGKKICKENGGVGLECRALKNEARSQGKSRAFYEAQAKKRDDRLKAEQAGTGAAAANVNYSNH